MDIILCRSEMDRRGCLGGAAESPLEVSYFGAEENGHYPGISNEGGKESLVKFVQKDLTVA